MKAIPWKSLLPVFVALALFYALSLAYFSPVLEGKQMVQGDQRNWLGMAQEIIEHREATDGEEPLWTGSMFSGMPAYQISVKWPATALTFVDRAFHGFLPVPAGYLFLYLIGMYVLMCCLRIDPWLAILGAVAFGFSSYFFAILEAGHNSKANAIGYMPMVLGAVFVLFRGRMMLGAALLALFLALQVMMNHLQITYYLGFVIALFVMAEAVRVVREKEFMPFIKRGALAAVAVVLALASNTGLLWTTYAYGAETTRGKSELTVKPDGSSADDTHTSGLDRDYVVQWSYGKKESFTLLVPNAKGGASGSIIQKQADFNKISDPQFRNAVLKEYQDGGYVNSYWGDQSFTSGPVYVGAFIVLLFLLMLTSIEGAGRWWVLASVPLLLLMLWINRQTMASEGVAHVLGMPAPIAAGALLIAYLLAGLWFMRDALVYALFSALLITLMLSWGQNLMMLTDFFLDHVPGYSKFRAVTIILVIVELALPVLGMLYLDKLIKSGNWSKLAERRFLIPTASVLVVLVAFAVAPSSFFDFISDGEQAKFADRVDSGAVTEAQMHVLADGIKDYRIGVFTADVWRSFAFVLMGGLSILLCMRMKWNSVVLVLLLTVITLADSFTVDKRYVNNEKDKGRYLAWEDPKEHAFPFDPTAADMAILQGEWNPQAEALQKTTLERMKKERAGERGTDKLVGKSEEVITRFGSLRRTSDYRVLSTRDPFNDSRVSYFHKSVGGYHGAKLKRYQELIEFQLVPAIMRVGGLLNSGTSMPQMDSLLATEGVLNMLNIRYLIYATERPPIRNNNALGSAWFVDEVRMVKNADEEITSLGKIDPRKTALVDERFKTEIGDAAVVADPSASVSLDNYTTNDLKYTVRSNAGGVVVFSAIWYGEDWHAYIDGKEAPHARADYVLRAMRVPAGEHKVEFKVEGKAYATAKPIMIASSILILLLVLGSLWMELRAPKTEA